ncbi:MAG: hypothetical protein MI867_14150 [Pseudomonadales bacterium]|nr:hypothetical protein [Pseudomonadales bacterium]
MRYICSESNTGVQRLAVNPQLDLVMNPFYTVAQLAQQQQNNRAYQPQRPQLRKHDRVEQERRRERHHGGGKRRAR